MTFHHVRKHCALLILAPTLYCSFAQAQDNSFADDFSEDLLSQRYSLYTDPGASIIVENGKLAVNVASNAGDSNSEDADVNLLQPTDYLEGEVVLSSESALNSVSGRLGARLTGRFYNDTADGGVDGRLGDVEAVLSLDSSGNGMRRAEICLLRYDDADGNSRTGMLTPDDPGNRCDELPIRIKFDETYRASISLDRATSMFTFRLNGVTQSFSVGPNFFEPSNPTSRISIYSRSGATAVGSIDNIRTAINALTATEQAEGADTPAEFPTATSDSDMSILSATDAPINFLAPINFVDDFSGDSASIGFSQWPNDSTDSSIGYYDGALELQVSAQSEDPDQGSSTALNFNRDTDSVSARVSLSSRSSLPAGRAEASFDLETVFYNDTADGGFNDREGDIQTKLRWIYQGNGTMRVQAELRRRNANGDNDRLDVFDGNDRFDFVDTFQFLPQLDTIYDFSIALDRDQGTMTYSVGDMATTVSLPTAAFKPAQRRVEIRAYHQGISGRAVVKLYSVTLDDYQHDFTDTELAIAPYRPAYDTERAGVDIGPTDDGRLRLSVDGRIAGQRNSRLVVRGVSDYVGASISLSSESVVAPDGKVFVGVSGSLYNAVMADASDQNGNVFAALRLARDGSGEMYVETCAWQSTDADFNDSIELIGGDPSTCQRLSTVPQLDTMYLAFISLDREANTLTYHFSGEEFVYNIGTEIFDTSQPFNGVRARPTDDSLVVAYVDNLAFSANAVPLADSGVALNRDISAEVLNNDSESSTDSSGLSSSGSGCSVGLSGRNDPLMAWLLLGAIGSICVRRKKIVSQE